MKLVTFVKLRKVRIFKKLRKSKDSVILHEATQVILRLFPCEVTQVTLTLLLQKATQVIKNCLIRGDSSTEMPEVGQ